VLHHGGIRTTAGGLTFSSAVADPAMIAVAKAKAAAIRRAKKPPCRMTMR